VRASAGRLAADAAGLLLTLAALLLCTAVLVAALPLLLLLRLLAPWLPLRPRAAARLVLCYAAYLATFELGALAFALTRGTARRARDGRDAERLGLASDARLAELSACFFRTGLPLAGLRLDLGAMPAVPPGRPVLLLARHAGLLNTQFGVHLVTGVLGRRLRAIAKRAVCADPGLFLMIRHTRLRVFRWNRDGRIQALLRLRAECRSLGGQDAFLLFPEGTNYTAARRRRRVEKFGGGAASGAELVHLLPPVTVGVQQALRAAPDAEVLLVAHTGIEDLLSWTGCLDYPPLGDGVIRVAGWLIPAAAVPREPDAVADWLAEWWLRLDSWVAATRAAPPQPEPPFPVLPPVPVPPTAARTVETLGETP